ncbi:MAG TPA: hypothetical protein ACN46Y_04370, partial [Prochlorococcus sp.]
NFKIMTTFNSTQPNSELIDEELALTSLNGIAGGIDFDEPETPEEEKEQDALLMRWVRGEF